MEASGYMDCTDYVGLLKLKSNLWYFDTPGAGSNESNENITRAVLGLEMLEDNDLTTFKLQDFSHVSVRQVPRSLKAVTKSDQPVSPDEDAFSRLFLSPHLRNATLVDNVLEGIEPVEVTLEEWSNNFKPEFTPDVILYMVAPHMQFLRDDGAFLRALLRVHADKVIVELNFWLRDGTQVVTEANVEDTEERIRQVYQGVFPDGSVAPYFVRINTLTGAGINDMTTQICQHVPQENLGKIQFVLQGKLKSLAERERSRRFQCTLNRIAARVALNAIDQKLGTQDLIDVAASGVAFYTTLTFEATERFADMLHAQQSITFDEQIEELKKARSVPVYSSKPGTVKVDISERVPILEEVEEVIYERKQVIKRIIEHRQKSFFSRAWINFVWALRKTAAFLSGEDTEAFHKMDQEMKERKFSNVSKEVEGEENVPVTRIVTRVIGYKDNPRTIDTIISETEELVWEKPLQGGLPVIEFLIGLGLGMKQFCLGASKSSSLSACIMQKQHEIRQSLEPHKTSLEQFIQQGGNAETQIFELLDAILGSEKK